MIWQQGAVCFLLWIAYGWWMRNRSAELRARMAAMPRRGRVLYGSVGLVGAAVALIVGLFGLAAAGGLGEEGLTLWAWPLVALLGLGFVHMQLMGAAALITLVQDEETARAARASQSKGKEPE